MTEYEELWAYKFVPETKVEHKWCVSKEEESENKFELVVCEKEETTKQYSRFDARWMSKESE